MQNYNGAADAADAARALVVAGDTGLADFAMGKLMPLTRTGASPVDLIVSFAEAVYHHRAVATEGAKAVAAGCALVCETFGFHAMQIDSRGSRIAQLLDGIAVDEEPVAKAEWAEPAAADAA